MDYIVVASHVRYSEARTRLLDGLQAAGVSKSRIIVVLNGSEYKSVYTQDGHTVVAFTSNLFEYSAFLVPGVIGAAPDDAFLLVHDTCLAGADFARKATGAFQRFRHGGHDILWCSSTGQCNVCVFGPRAGEAAWALWGSLDVLDKLQAIDMEHRASARLSIKGVNDLDQSYVEEATRVVGTDAVYSSGQERIVLHIPFLDLTKYYVDMTRRSEHPSVP